MNANFSFNMEEIPPGDYLLRVSLHSPKEGSILGKDIKLIRISFLAALGEGSSL